MGISSSNKMARLLWKTASRLCLQTCVLLVLMIIPITSTAVPVLLDTTVYTPVYVTQYFRYSDVRLFKFEVPPMATDGRFYMVANRTDSSCPVIDVVMTIQSGGYPVISPRNETFPSDFYLKRSDLQHVLLKADGTLVSHVVTSPIHGTWYGVAYAVEQRDTVIKKMTDGNCRFTIATNLSTVGWETIPELLIGNINHPQRFTLLPDQTLSYLRFFIDKRTWAFEVNISNCVENGVALQRCPLQVYARSGALPTYGTVENVYANCSAFPDGEPCQIDFVGPVTNTFQYIKVLKGGSNNITFSVTVAVRVCGVEHIQFFENLDRVKRQAQLNDVIIDPLVMTKYRHVCVNMMPLFRTTGPGVDFVTTYALKPSSLQFVENLVFIPSLFARVFYFEVHPQQDSGGTLRFSLLFNVSEKQVNGATVHSNITVCLQRGEVPVQGSLLRCHPDNVLNVSSVRDDLKSGLRRIPYPETGFWYLAFQQNCYYYNSSTMRNEEAVCPQEMVLTKFDLRVTACLDQGCGDYGDCRLHYGSRYAVSVCNCRGGVRGYACDDWSAASSKAVQMVNTLLLTLSNLFFIPSVTYAIVKKRYAEAVVYFSNMFFSTFYHACDMGPWSVYRVCIMPYTVMQHLDFFCSIMSFWVTLIAISEIRGSLYSVAHMVGAIALAMAVDWQMHGIVPYLVPVVIGVLIVITSFAVRSYYKRKLYPGKWRLLQMVPGLVLALVGIAIFIFLETDTNYPYTHSGWHLCMSLSILFFIPARSSQMPPSPATKGPSWLTSRCSLCLFSRRKVHANPTHQDLRTTPSEPSQSYAIELDPASSVDLGESGLSISSEDSILRFHQETSDLASLVRADSTGLEDDDDDKDDQLLQDF